MTSLLHSPAWKAVAAVARAAPELRSLFTSDRRATEWTLKLDDSFAVDVSKQLITRDIQAVLLALARQQELEHWRRSMFSGEAINRSEKRAVLHTALRARADAVIAPEGASNVVPTIFQTRGRMDEFAESVRQGGKITDIVHIGIGGSHLGPELAVQALRPYHDGPRIHFVANIDPAHLAAALRQCAPKSTLFILASKTFTTQETLENGKAAKEWLMAALGTAAVADHFAAATANAAAAQAFGIKPERIFPFEEWVGGRFSLWSSVGLPVLLAVGPQKFDELLLGAREMDEHFEQAPLGQNLPVILALLDVWNRNFNNRHALAIIPYAQDLALLPAFLQQLMMESNGKSVDKNGEQVDYMTCPVVFGQAGSNAQHAFFQQLHQGPEVVPSEFIVPLHAAEADEALAPGQHKLLVAHAAAQSAALLHGRESADWHRRYAGNRPSTTIWFDRLSPRNLGRLIALYEHRVACCGWLWGINSFDQFGVELGKEFARDLAAGKLDRFDASTQALVARIR
jgi:glucose-6-phosphate isomerase